MRRGSAGLPPPIKAPGDSRGHNAGHDPVATTSNFTTTAPLPTQAHLPPLQLRHQDTYAPADHSLPPLRALLSGPSTSSSYNSSSYIMPTQASSWRPHAAQSAYGPGPQAPYPMPVRTGDQVISQPTAQPVNQQYRQPVLYGLPVLQQHPDYSRPFLQPAPRPDPNRPVRYQHNGLPYNPQPSSMLYSQPSRRTWPYMDPRSEAIASHQFHTPTPVDTRESSVLDSGTASPVPRSSSPIINQAILRVQPQIPAALGRQIEDGSLIEPKATKKRKAVPAEKPIKRAKVCTRLGAKRPVKTFVPIDIWLQIFRFVEPKQLFEMRTVCQEFYNCLKNKQMPWRECRIAFFGKSIPPPPDGLKPGREEQMYMDLLAGHTQSCMSCGTVEENRKARKVYWAFLRRWCESCFKEKTVNVRSLACYVLEMR